MSHAVDKFNMKSFLVYYLLFISLAATADVNKKVDSILMTLEFDSFVQGVEKVKQLKSIEKLDEIEYELKRFQSHLGIWSFFDEERYLTELKYTLKKGFKEEDLASIEDLLTNPFIVKTIKKLSVNRDVFTFIHNVRESDVRIYNVDKDRLKMLEDLYGLIGLQIQHEYIQNVLKNYVESGNDSIREFSMVTKKNILISPVLMERRLKRSKEFLLEYIAVDLSGIQAYELKELKRRLEQKPVHSRFFNFIMNFHFTYMKAFYEKLGKNKDS